MAANYVLLEKITVGAAGASSVTFSGIPQTGYTDLVIKASSRTDRASLNDYFSMRFNGSTSGYTDKSLYGNGSGVQSETNNGTTNAFMFVSEGGNNTANTFGNHEIYIPNYTSANYKSVSSDGVAEDNATGAIQGLNANLWSNTAAITSIALNSIGTYVQYSTFYLYGVAALGTTPAIVPYATGGDTIMTDGTYWYHTFVSSGTFTPAKALTAHYLVVAGGGGAPNDNGQTPSGGGGGGGLRSTVTATGGGGSLESALSLASGTGYTVTIGAGGAGGITVGDGTDAVAGSNSVFSTITSTGGGRGGRQNSTPGQAGGTGGSGGGGSFGGAAGSGTANQGYNGGGSAQTTYQPSGGGGGAGAAGGTGVGATAGAGGNGVATSISGSSVTYGGGGGGSLENTGPAGAGGTGGGGAGGFNGNGGNGTANLGGGGGGNGGTGSGGNGGSGIVIVRYAV